MIIRIVDIQLDDNYNLRCELRKIFGLGLEKASYVADLLGIGKRFFTKFANRFLEDCLNIIILINYNVNQRLDSLLNQHYKGMLAIKLRRAMRLMRGLPNRGQGTHGNSKQNRYYLNYKWQEQKEEKEQDVRGSTIKNLKLKSKKIKKK